MIKIAVVEACSLLEQTLEFVSSTFTMASSGDKSMDPSLGVLVEQLWGWNKTFRHTLVLEAVFKEQSKVASGLRVVAASLARALAIL